MTQHTKALHNMADRGVAGYPVATVAYFGPDNTVATKAAVAILPDESFQPTARECWVGDGHDLRNDAGVNEQILRFIREHGAKTVVMDDRIIGCPHEEDPGLLAGSECPHCPFWAPHRRRTSEVLH